MFIEFLNHVLFSTLVCYPFTFTLIVAAKPLRLMGSFLERRVKENFLASNYYLEDISSNSIDNVKRSSFLNTAVQCLFSSVAEIPGLRQHIP